MSRKREEQPDPAVPAAAGGLVRTLLLAGVSIGVSLVVAEAVLRSRVDLPLPRPLPRSRSRLRR